MSKQKNWKAELSEYIKQGEPGRAQKAKNWETAIGLQKVDGLNTSSYLIGTAKEHIEGNIDIKDAISRINNYYKVFDERKSQERELTEEADKVAVRITEILSENSFNFNPTELIVIHERLFKGIYKKAGKIRDYNFTKNEWVLNNDTVTYASYETIMPALQYDFEQEKNFSYKNLPFDECVNHLCRFTSNIWQVHPFCEGNTRTTAVFIIKYLRTFGFKINDDVFAENSWYFRNSLVRANYKNFQKNVFEDISYLEKFFYNLLSDTNYELKNRYIHVDYEKEDDYRETLHKEWTLEEQAIINLIKRNPGIKQEEIAGEIRKSVRTVKTIMREMQEKGIIERKKGKRNREWVIL